MKKQMVLCAVATLLSSGVLAKNENEIRKVINRDSYNGELHYDRRDAVNACNEKIQQMVHTAEETVDEYFEHGAEFECSEIIFSTESDFSTKTYIGSMSRGWGAVDHKYTIDVNTICVPRKLSEKTVYSLAKRCEENPTESCFNEKILKKIDTVGRTRYTYSHKGSGCSPIESAKKDSNTKIVARDFIQGNQYNDRSDAVTYCENSLADALKNIEYELSTYFPKGEEYECREIIITSETEFDTIGHLGSMSRGWAAIDHTYTVATSVACVPRTFSEKVLYSMAKRCEVNPTEACFTDEALAKLDSMGSTKYTFNHSGSSCKLKDL